MDEHLIKKEIKERVDFKLSEILESITNHIKNFHSSSFDLALNNKLQESQKAYNYSEAFKIFKDIFLKEITMSVPYDEIYLKNVNIMKNKCIDSIVHRFEEKTRGFFKPPERYSFERFVVNEIQELIRNLL